MLNRLLQHNPSDIALSDTTGVLTYGALRVAVMQLAEKFSTAHAQYGGAFAIDMPDGNAWVVADLACMVSGIPAVPIPPFFTESQRQHALKAAGVTLSIGKAYQLTPTGFVPVALTKDTAKITFTSGTTGQPKGVCLSVEGMFDKVIKLRDALGDGLIQHHRSLLPLAVLLENVGGVYVSLLAGAQVTLGLPEYTPKALANALKESQATSCILVPELLKALVTSGETFPALRYAAVGGAHVSASLITKAREHGIAAYEGYGLSEACSVVALNTPQYDRVGSCGKLLEPISLAQDGEILLQQAAFLGYVGESAPAKPFATGDIGRIDENGFLHIEGRKKNLIITSYGRNFSPEWVEAMLTGQPGIQQAVLFGDGKPFNCAVLVTSGPMLASHAIRNVNAELPNYARVGAYIVANAPFSAANEQMTSTGKLNRRVIEAHYDAQLASIYQEVLA
jgi:long-subunit acyl-CoA synthetase (AMP-forming)